MAIPAMAGGVGAAAVWRERTGQAQELSIDLRQALYGIAPWVRFLADYNIAAGTLPPNWLPAEWTWDPTVNGRNIQAPFLLGNPLGFQVFETKDGRLITPTGIYPHHFIGFLALIGAGPDLQQITERIRTFDSAELEHMAGEAGMIMGIHRTAAEWLARRSLALRPAHSRRHLYVTSHTKGFSHFVTSMTAPVASGWSVRRVGLAPTGKRRLLTAHAKSGRSRAAWRTRQMGSFATVPACSGTAGGRNERSFANGLANGSSRPRADL